MRDQAPDYRRGVSPPPKAGREPLRERIIEKLLFACAALSIFVMLGILATFLFEAIGFFREVSIIEFFTETRWTPQFDPKYFGVLPLVAGTMLVSMIALGVAVPAGLGSAIFLSEYAPDKVRRIVKPILEILAGIPTVVYGYFALTYVTPQLQNIIPDLQFFNALSAGIVMGVMIIPLISSLSEDAMVAVPRSLRDGAYALGATKAEVAVRVVLPSALSGIIASIMLAMSRAIGETMIVTIAAGSTSRWPPNPLESIQTLTGYIAQISLGEAPFGSLEYRTIFAVGLTLFLIVFAVNLFSQWVSKRFWRAY